MEFKPAVMQDLEPLKCVYKEIIKNMNENGIQIWIRSKGISHI